MLIFVNDLYVANEVYVVFVFSWTIGYYVESTRRIQAAKNP